MTDKLIARAEQHEYQKLFIQDLNWSAPDQPPVVVDYDGHQVKATNVSSYKGLRVWVIDKKPDSKLEVAVDQRLAKTSTDRIVIFHGDTDQVWRWPVRRATGNTTSTRLSRHKHRSGSPDPGFGAKLEVIRLPVDVTLDANSVLAKVRLAFDVEAHNETKYASKLMARLYTSLERAYPPDIGGKTRDHEISVTLARVLFLMFGDDTDMWQQDLFRDYVHEQTAADGTDIGDRLTSLFTFLNTDVDDQATAADFVGFRYVNGGIFSEQITLPTINADFREAVLEACDRDWTAISPAIFGSMFQSVRDDKTRRELGEHYTSEENILKTLNPLFLDELRQEYANALKRDTEQKQINGLNALWRRLGNLRFMDPACGCGNFVIIAYRELRDLELHVMEALLDRQRGSDQLTLGGELVRGLRVTLDHFYGIEIDEWPARIASTAMFLVDRQCDLRLRDRFGEPPERLPLRTEANIASGRNALREDWETICPAGPNTEVVIAGNPPFIGMARMSPEQQADNRYVFAQLPEAKGQRTGRLDYVACWYPKAISYIQRHPTTRCAFVSTNSLTQGDQARAFDPIIRAAHVSISFAYRTFPWRTESARDAVVHCVIIGLCANASNPRIYTSDGVGHVGKCINFYLLDTQLPAPSKRRRPPLAELPRMSKGNQPWPTVGLLVEDDELEAVQEDPAAATFLRPFVQTTEMVKGRTKHCIWMPVRDAQAIRQSPELRHRFALVAAERRKPSAHSVADIPTNRFSQVRQPTSRYLAVPEVSSVNREYLPIRYYEPNVIAGNKLMVIEDAPLWVFAVLSSRPFTAWVHVFAGRMKSDPSISPDLTYNAFPWKTPNTTQRQLLDAAGKDILDTRAKHAPATLEQLYHPSRTPDDLKAAHSRADLAVGELLDCPPTDDYYELAEFLLLQHHKLQA